MTRYHEQCARECGCLGDADTSIIDPADMSCDIGGWDSVCEYCGNPSEAAQAYDAQQAAYWSWYFSGGMLDAYKVEHALRNASDAELDAISRDAGKRISRPT